MALWTTEPASSTAAVQAIYGGAIGGLIFTTATSKDPALMQAAAQQLPIVLVNRSIAGLNCDQVTSGNVAGGRLVAEYFWRTDARLSPWSAATTSSARAVNVGEGS